MKRLSKDERNAIEQLKKVAEIWPNSLWLFSASGTLCVMKKDSKGNRAVNYNKGYQQEYEVDMIDIENDGGDF